MDKFAALKQYFGHTTFRPGQEETIDALLNGRDVLGVMPTGAGKSICYQIPALLLPGVTLVISPLISLMQDQVTALLDSGIPAAFLNSTLQEGQYKEIWHTAVNGGYKILYAAPERLFTDSFLNLMQQLQISMVAVDEAHCVSQWGQDFRPSYLRISEFIEQLPSRPVIGAFTATATEQVKGDITRLLKLQSPLSVTTGFDRPNLYFGVAKPRNKTRYLVDYITGHPGKSGIVYCAARKSVEAVCKELCSCGIKATRYHAGLPVEERRQNQEDFIYDRSPVMVATNAFGMGIDKSNVSFVLHMNMPKNIENYYQEAGRAGRDGEAAECILLYAPADIQTARFFIENGRGHSELEEAEAEQVAAYDKQRLDQMIGYCKTTRCLRACLLGYFGESHSGNCGNCSSCTGDFAETDITLEAQKILSGVARVERLWPGGLGISAVTQMLRGSHGQSTLDRHLDRLPTYGILKDTNTARLRLYFDALTEEDYLENSGGDYPVVRLGPKAPAVLFHGERVSMKERRLADWEKQSARRAPRKKTARLAAAAPADDNLLQHLKNLRTELSQKANVPAYVVFSNAALSDMAAKAPHTMEEFLEVSGVGEMKAKRYGKQFLAAIAEFEQNNVK